MGEAALLRVCREMLAAHREENWDDAEIDGTPVLYMIGHRRVASSTVNLGLWMVLFHSEGIGTDYERYTLNERGREFAETGRMPGWDLTKRAPVIAAATRGGG